MSIEEFIIRVYLMVEVYYTQVVGETPLRQRGYAPKLTDIEAITIELVGEFLGLDCEKKMWEYFCRHWLHWFPNLGSRSNFAKHIANLWHVNQLIHKEIISNIVAQGLTYQITDGFPIAVCHYARSRRHGSFKSIAEYGYCAAKDEKYYGFKGNLLISSEGVIIDIVITAANIDERESLLDMTDHIQDHVLADMGLIGDEYQQMLSEQYGIFMHTPKRKNMTDSRPKEFLRFIKSARRRVESAINQLQEHFHLTKVWARDLWHLTHRISRKILAHTIALFINKSIGRRPTQFDGLIA